MVSDLERKVGTIGWVCEGGGKGEVSGPDLFDAKRRLPTVPSTPKEGGEGNNDGTVSEINKGRRHGKTAIK